MESNALIKEAEAMRAQLVQHRRWLHAHAEVGFSLTQTRDYVKSTLEALGLKPELAGQMGIICEIVGSRPGNTFLLRADMDGLPIQEESGEAFSCETGAMHACGHDMHTAILLGAAALLQRHREALTGTVRLLFQPAEEVFQGAQDMIRSGALQNVSGAMMLHVMTGVPIPAGTAVVSAPGVSAPGADYFSITVEGAGCHGSAPQNGVDPIHVAAHILLGLQEISARELAISEQAVLTLGTFHAGNAANMIPQRATLGGTLRTYDEDTRTRIKARIQQIASGIATAFRAEAKVDYGSGCPSLLNDKSLCEAIHGYLCELLGRKQALSVQDMGDAAKNGQTGGSEDFAYISREVPSVMVALAAGEPQKGFTYPLHHPKVRFDEAALPVGSAGMAYAAMRWLEQHGNEENAAMKHKPEATP